MFGLDVAIETVLLFLVIFLLALYWIRQPKNLPPGPRGWPVLGVSLDVLRSKYHFVTFTKWSKTYGGVMGVNLGRRLFLILSDIGSIKEALLRNGDAFSDRATVPLMELTDGINGSLVLESGPIWKERRRFGIGALRHFGMGKKSIEPSINEEARYLLECIADKAGKPFDPTHFVNNAVSNIICKICFGYRFEYSDPKFAGLLNGLRENIKQRGPGSLVSFFPRLIYTPPYSNILNNIHTLESFINGIIKEHRTTYDENDVRDIIDMHLGDAEHRKAQVDSGQFAEKAFSDKALSRTIEIMFIAGSDTTTNTLLWLLMYLALYQDVQKKIQAEIDQVIGNSRQPSMTDSPNMPYTNAALYEIQRIRPIIPLGVPYRTSKAATLKGYHVPKDTGVLINIWAVHHDPATWPEPEKFDPTRFLSADGKTITRHECVIPFGIGRRACLGENLAKTEIFIFLVNLLQQFRFAFPDNKPIPGQRGTDGPVFTAGPYEICTTRRN